MLEQGRMPSVLSSVPGLMGQLTFTSLQQEFSVVPRVISEQKCHWGRKIQKGKT
jgi:hypothetical protein